MAGNFGVREDTATTENEHLNRENSVLIKLKSYPNLLRGCRTSVNNRHA